MTLYKFSPTQLPYLDSGLMGSAVMALGGVLAIVLRSQFSFADGEHDDW